MHMDRIGLPARYMDRDGRIDVARLKAEISIAKVAADATDLKASGDELKGLCPIHLEETASFFINEGKQVFHCHGCDAGGDVIELHRRLHHVGFRQACLDLAGAEHAVPAAVANPVLIAMRRAESVKRARRIWQEATPIGFSLTETYLVNRGVGHAVPGSIRHTCVARWWDEDGREGRREPAMIAALQDREGRVCGIQRTFLDREGRKSNRGNARLSLGRVRGCAVRFGPVADTVMLAAGVEDGLAVRMMFPGASVWVAGGDGNLPHVRFPSEVRRVIVCGDADAPGRIAAAAATEAYAAIGLQIEDLVPRAGKDFNEEWLLLHA
jgi:DNA primase